MISKATLNRRLAKAQKKLTTAESELEKHPSITARKRKIQEHEESIASYQQQIQEKRSELAGEFGIPDIKKEICKIRDDMQKLSIENAPPAEMAANLEFLTRGVSIKLEFVYWNVTTMRAIIKAPGGMHWAGIGSQAYHGPEYYVHDYKQLLSSKDRAGAMALKFESWPVCQLHWKGQATKPIKQLWEAYVDGERAEAMTLAELAAVTSQYEAIFKASKHTRDESIFKAAHNAQAAAKSRGQR